MAALRPVTAWKALSPSSAPSETLLFSSSKSFCSTYYILPFYYQDPYLVFIKYVLYSTTAYYNFAKSLALTP